MLGHEKFGVGPTTVIVLNDWICDTSTWDGARAYLDCKAFTWVFSDVRGYGRSRGQLGEFTVPEAAADVIALADSLHCSRFAVIGHSMSTLMTIHLAQQRSDRVTRAVLLTPAPPAGFPADAARLQAIRELSYGDDAKRAEWLRMRLGEHVSEGFVRFKTERWRAATDTDAVAAYAAMFSQGGVPEPTARIDIPVLAVTGERDMPVMRRDEVTKSLAPICARLEVESIADSGHYPMQETPPLTVAIVERFLRTESKQR
jgi:3-oxoadipate enol-lactonase